MNFIKKIKNRFKDRDFFINFLSFTLTVLVFFLYRIYPMEVSFVLWIILLVLLAISIFIITVLSGFMIMRALFKVAGGLSLLIFISQAYCLSPEKAVSSNESLKVLLIIGLFYTCYIFLKDILKQIEEKFGKIKDIKINRENIAFFLSLSVFLSLFTWHLFQVLKPIFLGICIFK